VNLDRLMVLDDPIAEAWPDKANEAARLGAGCSSTSAVTSG